MASTTSNLGLTKPAGTDKALVSVINSNSDILDSAAGGLMDALAIVAQGNTHGAISAGQYVYVRGHDTLAEGLYTANSAIAANATLSSSNLTADSDGGLNSLNSNLTSLSEQMANTTFATIQQDGTDKVFFNRIGAFVICNFSGYVLSNYQNDNFIPANFRPTNNIAFLLFLYNSNSDNYIAVCNSGSNGRLYVRRKNAVGERDTSVSGYQLFGTCAWCVV